MKRRSSGPKCPVGPLFAAQPLRQRGQDRSSIGCDPAFALITGRAHRNHQVLHQKPLITLEARSFRDRGFDDLIFNVDPRRHRASAPPLCGCRGLWRLSALVHAAGFDVGAGFQAFQMRDLFAQFGNGLFQPGNFTQQLNQQSLRLWTAQPGKRRRRRHTRQRVHAVESAQGKNAGGHGFAPVTRKCSNSLFDCVIHALSTFRPERSRSSRVPGRSRCA